MIIFSVEFVKLYLIPDIRRYRIIKKSNEFKGVLMIFTGVLVNFGAVLVGSLIGLFFKNKLNQKYHVALMDGIALGVIAIGVIYAIKTENILVMMISIIIGTILGTLLKFNDGLDALGDNLQKRLKIAGESFSEGFAAASILFCVGSMAIMGCIESGLNNNHTILLTKSIMDGVAAIFLTSALGVGVLFSSFSILIYQGVLTLLASFFAGSLNMSVINEMSAVGGVILLGIAINMLNHKKIKSADMVLSFFLPIALVPLLSLLG